MTSLPRPMRNPAPPRCCLVLLTLTLTLALTQAAPSADSHTLDHWLTAQTKVDTWSADLLQTRHLKALNQPLLTPGRVWFKAPNLFRWELGNPVRTVAIREPERLVLLYPALKRAEIYPLTGDREGPWRSSLALLEAGFPRHRSQLESQFDIVSATSQDPPGNWTLELAPKDKNARRWISRLQVVLQLPSLNLTATELEFGDGSRLRNDFTNILLNPPLDPTLLNAQIPADYSVVTPAGAP